MFAFPLHHRSDQLGALDLYRSVAGPLDLDAMAAAQTLADVAAAYLLNARVRSELAELSARALHTSSHDALTGLPNRSLLFDHLELALARSERSGKQVAVVYLDLDRFKAVNDTYGHQVGDELLCAIADRLSRLVRPGDTLARLQGDEFVLLCEDLDDRAQIQPVTARLAAAMHEPFALTAADVSLTASMGIAFAGRGRRAGSVLHDADLAMYAAKRRDGAGSSATDRALPCGSAPTTIDLTAELSGAAARGELHLDYLPIVAASDVVGAEALLRWSHPSLGTMGPATVVPLADRGGLTGEIVRWVLTQACLDRRRFAAAACHDLQVSVNVALAHVATPAFASTMAEVLADTATEPAQVLLEVTDSSHLVERADTERAVADLRRSGVRIAHDNFGAGTSSWTHLRRFPADVLKIDRSLLADGGREASIAAITEAIVQVGHALEMTVVATGVETARQHALVVEAGCDSVEGYLFARPMDADGLAALLAFG